MLLVYPENMFKMCPKAKGFMNFFPSLKRKKELILKKQRIS